MMPKIPEGSFTKKLFSLLYLSYFPKEKFKYAMKMNCDDRGSFTELMHTVDCGQMSINERAHCKNFRNIIVPALECKNFVFS